MIRLALALLAGLVVAPALAQTPPPPALDRLQRADGAAVVPDRFLRAWDPITVMFPADQGPAAGGAEDAPERLVVLSPPKPGAWQWLGPRALQFRPAEPWEPLRRVRVAVGATATTLVPLLPVPLETAPADRASGTVELDTIALTFAQPVDVEALARLLTLELRPQSPAEATPPQFLTAQDFAIRPVERAARADRQTYLVVLRQPVPDGRVATLRLRLSDAAGLDDPIFALQLRSAAPFELVDSGCGDGYSGLARDGVTLCTGYRGALPRRPSLSLHFSETPEKLDIVAARAALRITPPLDDLAVTVEGSTLTVNGRFEPDAVYRLSLAAGALRDVRNRPLAAPANLRFGFAAAAPALAWDAAEGIVERLGPQMVPLRGRGYDRADLRIHPIDPLGRDFWPFPQNRLATSDDRPPPLPGNEPAPYVEAPPIAAAAMAARIAALGTPSASELIDLPIRRGGVDAKFGLDLAPLLARVAGPGQPGTYLLGLRPVDGRLRQWARVQVTDLTLTTVEEADRVRFVVTSLATAQPVAGAEVRLEGVRERSFVTLARGVTGADGSWTLAAPSAAAERALLEAPLQRIVVAKATDTLVLEPQRGPQQYAAETWSRPRAPWLGWTAAALAPRQEKPRLLCHVFTERPIYRPEEPILIAGMVRRYLAGGLATAEGGGEVVIAGPDDQEWRLPVTLDDVGGFHLRFDRKTEATGDYAIHFEPENAEACGAITVKKEAYRLPTFEVVLNGPATVPLDAPFQVNLLARFFAGGLLSDRPIAWRVTQFPHAWTPPGRDGFQFSSDSRFSGEAAFRSTPVLNREAKTDAGGSAALALDPTIEPTAQPRQYLVEATVTGDDDIQVRTTQRVTALPPFVLGVKVPRYLPKPGAIDPELVALDAEGHEVAGLALTLRLIHRQWNSLLQASDFAQGSARYETQVIDETVEERHLVSGAAPLAAHFEAREAGVYLVELEATDKVGRRQTVRVDLFMAGDTPVTWSRPPAQTVTVTADRDRYAPGETATLVLQSPFQTARALAVVEEPGGRFRYDWLDVANGFARYQVTLRKQQVPRLPVHFLLMRPRLPGSNPAGAPFDQGKPVTLAATKWIAVTPVDNQVKLRFEAPATARPAEEIELVLHLSDPAGRPLAGEATVWMVDQAVLALAREQPLDPLPQFIVDRPTRMAARDTRAMAFGVIPLTESPGGDEAGDFGMENISVRKNFTPVPFYEPRVKFGPDGTARLRVKLPDTLTVYMLRAKVISGPDRFGFGTGELRIRLPVVAQPVLPRFVRPGDSFAAGLLGRIVEGPGGEGRAAISLDHLATEGAKEQTLAWADRRPARLDFAVSVPEPPPGTEVARVRFLLQRTADRASDAVQVDLPIRPDRPVEHRRQLLSLGPDGTAEVAAPTGPVRPASYRASLTLAADPVPVRLLAGLDYLLRYPLGCTEQRIALTAGELALLPFTPLVEAAGLRARLAGDVAATLGAIRQTTDEDGLVAAWPRTRGSVWLTAAAYRVLVAAERAGLGTDKPMAERLAKVLTAALRSDYPRLLAQAELFERVAALTALADGGRIAPDYAAELAARAAQMPTDATADIAGVLAALPAAPPRLLPAVLETLWGRVNLINRDGRPVYAGLTDRPATALILPSEARSLAAVVRAVALAAPQDARLPVLRAGLLGLADGQGWGNTNATAAALRALAAAWQPPAAPIPASLALPDGTTNGVLDRAHPLLQAATRAVGPLRARAAPNLALLASFDYVPAQPGAQASARQDGFVLARTLYRVPPPRPSADGKGEIQPPPERLEPAADGALHLRVGDIVEELDELASPEERSNVALRLPLPAGLEPLNPALANAPAAAAPSAGPNPVPAWAAYRDDEVLAVHLLLPAGNATLRTRMRATVPGSFTLPPAQVEMMYRPAVSALTEGRRVIVER